jgi:hypothetical protein
MELQSGCFQKKNKSQKNDVACNQFILHSSPTIVISHSFQNLFDFPLEHSQKK